MNRKFAGLTVAALAAGLIVTSVGIGAGAPVHRAAVGDDTARAKATDKYKGRFKGAAQNGSKITVKGTTQGGEVTEVKSMNYLALMDCEITPGKVAGQAGWTFAGGAPVNAKRKFKVKGNNGQTPVSNLTFKGRFTSNFKKVKGTFRTSQWFEEEKDPPLPAERCDLEPTRYVAKR